MARMVLYFPLSSFLLLFANLLQNPRDSYIASDLKLMELVTSFLKPSTVPLSPFSTPASIQMFYQLYKIAVKFVEKSNMQERKKTKRVHDDIDSGEASQSHSTTEPAKTDFMVCFLFSLNVAYVLTSIIGPTFGCFAYTYGARQRAVKSVSL